MTLGVRQALGDATQALDLADAALRTGLDCGSPSTVARCAATQGRAYALKGDQRACSRSCIVAERALDRAQPEGEPAWIQFFTPKVLTGHMLAMARDLGRYHDVQRLAPGALASPGHMQRRDVLWTTELVGSYLPAEGNSHSDIDQACHLLSQVIPALGSLTSSRVLESVNSVRRALAAHAERPSVQDVEERFRSITPATSATV